MFWGDLDLAVIALDLSLFETDDTYKTIPIGGIWHPLMKVYGAGFPIVLGNNKDYRDIFYCSGEINSAILDEEGLSELLNYSMVHSCGISGGMSGGPLIDNKGHLLGINGMIGDAQFSQNESGDINSVDFDNLKYAILLLFVFFADDILFTFCIPFCCPSDALLMPICCPSAPKKEAEKNAERTK